MKKKVWDYLGLPTMIAIGPGAAMSTFESVRAFILWLQVTGGFHRPEHNACVKESSRIMMSP